MCGAVAWIQLIKCWLIKSVTKGFTCQVNKWSSYCIWVNGLTFANPSDLNSLVWLPLVRGGSELSSGFLTCYETKNSWDLSMRWKPEFGSKSPCCLCCDLNGLVYKVIDILVIFASFSVLFIFDVPSLKLHGSGAILAHHSGRVICVVE